MKVAAETGETATPGMYNVGSRSHPQDAPEAEGIP